MLARLKESAASKIGSMRILSSPTGERSKRLAAIVLILWWGGLNCLTGCALSLPDAAIESHCSMSGGDSEGDCCQSSARAQDSSTGQSIGASSRSTQSLSCCSLEAYAADVNRKLELVHGPAFIGMANWSLPLPIGEQHTLQPLTRWERPPARGSTYLRCCVLLI